MPVAPGTPGIGKVTTGLPAASHDTDVLPTFVTPSAMTVPGLAPSVQVFMVPASADFGAPCGLAQMRMSRSCTAAGIAATLPFVAGDLRARRVFVPRVLPADHLDVRVRLLVRARAGVIDPLAEGLVVGARAILRERARLAVHLNRAALGLIFERRDHVAFVGALQHALVPHPVEEHGPQVLGSCCGRVGRTGVRITATTPTLCAGRSRRPAGAATCHPARRQAAPAQRLSSARQSQGRPRARPLPS